MGAFLASLAAHAGRRAAVPPRRTGQVPPAAPSVRPSGHAAAVARISGRAWRACSKGAGSSSVQEECHDRPGRAAPPGEPRHQAVALDRARRADDRVLPRRRRPSPLPVLRARSFLHLMSSKAIYIGPGELIVGERGPAAEGDAHLPRAVLPHAGGPRHPRHAREDLLRRAGRGAQGVPRAGHPVLARTVDAPPDLRADDAPSGRRPTRRVSSRSSWSSGRPGHTVADDKIYRKGMRGLPGGHRSPHGRARLPRTTPRPTTGSSSCRACASRPTPSSSSPGGTPDEAARLAAGRDGPGPEAGTGTDRGQLRLGARARAAHVLGGAAGLLVRPPRRHHRAEHLGLVLPGAARPAPLPVLQARDRGGHADARAGEGAPPVLLGEVQQPAGAAEGRRDRGRERHLHRLLEHQHAAGCSPTAATA